MLYVALINAWAIFLIIFIALTTNVTQDVSAGGGGGSEGSEGEGASSAGSAGVPSPADLAANAAPVYLDEVPQCAGLNAKQCEDLLSGKYSYLYGIHY